MSLDTLKKEAAGLDDSAQKELMTFLAELRGRQRQERARKMDEKMDCNDPSRWLTLEDITARLSHDPAPADE